jgi:putative radical SAM enzyme (TIGR03279 family)
MKITSVLEGSIAGEAGLLPGDELLEINSQRVQDNLDLRFYEGDAELVLKIARGGEVMIFDIEKDHGESLGLEVEEMKVLSCGNDCIFCFVDQNPKGLRDQLYFRDGDYRLSFMYGNYTTMTNAGPAILRRIIAQRLSPQYISVHATDLATRIKLMGLKKDDRILEKIALLHDNDIDMHTQIVLCPGINDGEALEKTVRDLYKFRNRIISLAVVPVGLTGHRSGLAQITRVDRTYARALLDKVATWQKTFRRECGRGFVYASDEFYIVAGRPLPRAVEYDGFPQIENGVGMVRTFLTQFRNQSRRFPEALPRRRKLTIVTGRLAEGIMREEVLPRLKTIRNLRTQLVVAPNRLYGRSVTVSGLLSGKCVYSAMRNVHPGDLVLLPPDILNADGMFLDDMTLPQLEQKLKAPVNVFTGKWGSVMRSLTRSTRSTRPRALVRVT